MEVWAAAVSNAGCCVMSEPIIGAFFILVIAVLLSATVLRS
ncbi:hypothetical protein R2A130_3485 [Ahrensia sp. R2A130]|nr:hypothetical protein R2A130_3485 [Ahrensia sp. R2A130]